MRPESGAFFTLRAKRRALRRFVPPFRRVPVGFAFFRRFFCVRLAAVFFLRPFLGGVLSLKGQNMEKILNHLPAGCTFAAYRQPSGRPFGVYTPAGRYLAASFYEIRHRFSFVCFIAGVGQWAVLEPISQPELF